MIHDRTIPASTQTYLPVRDASGSVTALVRDDGNSTTIVAVYEYDPNGNLLRAQGEYAKKNPFTFGGGWMDWETGLVGAGSVYYSARLGRYINSGPSGAGDGISACFGVDPSISYHHTRQYARPSSRRNTSTPSWQSVNPAELAAYEAAWTAYETARVAYEQAAEAESMALDGERSHNPDCESPEDNTADEFIADEHDYHQNAVFDSRDHGLSDAYLIGTDHREGGAYIEYYSDGSMLVTNTLGSTLLIENDGTATLNFSDAQLEIMQAPISAPDVCFREDGGIEGGGALLAGPLVPGALSSSSTAKSKSGTAEVYIWDYRGKKVAYGHASMKLDDGTYISFWPQATGRDRSKISSRLYTVAEIQNQTYADDVRLKDGRAPDHIINVTNLDTDNIRNFWITWQDDKNWSTIRYNCAATIYNCLHAGGKPREFEFIWPPADVKNYANKYKDK
ncbi:RHS repeat-associated protein [Ereboglobus sp. PH5-10]|uniref:hypothetical protein n=1 Tax=Ereboglobus sp. PH5-10 TaxID=2940629 RepID=UPI002404EED4|nr:hypothetical protein [Ereboglobus sp. PH5-10]MDF9828243.1 RHS repeat-associated protein [Ereboglobus sp. PH5-10]